MRSKVHEMKPLILHHCRHKLHAVTAGYEANLRAKSANVNRYMWSHYLTSEDLSWKCTDWFCLHHCWGNPIWTSRMSIDMQSIEHHKWWVDCRIIAQSGLAKEQSTKVPEKDACWYMYHMLILTNNCLITNDEEIILVAFWNHWWGVTDLRHSISSYLNK